MRTPTQEDSITVFDSQLNWAERRVPIGFDGEGGSAGGDGGASDGDQSGSGGPGAGASGDGGTGGTQGGSDGGDALAAFETRLQGLEEGTRKLQAQRDKLQAENERLKKGDGGGEPQAFDQDAIVASLEERFQHRETMRTAAAELAETYPLADEGIYGRAMEFKSRETFEASLKRSHESTAARVNAAVESQVAEILADVEARYGLRIAPAGTSEGEQSADPTIEQINAMSLEEMAAFEQDNPGVLKRVLAAAGA